MIEERCARCNGPLEELPAWSGGLGEVICYACSDLEGYGLWRDVDVNGRFPEKILVPLEQWYNEFPEVLKGLESYRSRLATYSEEVE